jgi:hypothetical protein
VPDPVDSLEPSELTRIVRDVLTTKDLQSIATQHRLGDIESLPFGQLRNSVLEHLSPVEMRQIVRRARGSSLIKQEGIQHEGQVSIKRERSEESRSATKRQKGPAPVIDLTDD